MKTLVKTENWHIHNYIYILLASKIIFAYNFVIYNDKRWKTSEDYSGTRILDNTHTHTNIKVIIDTN